MLNIKKISLLLLVTLLFTGYDFLFLDQFQDLRVFNIIAEVFFATMAGILFLSIDELKGKYFYRFLNTGFFLAFVSMLVDALDQLHYHGELYTALGEKLTLMMAFTLIIIGVKNWIVDFSQLNSYLEHQVITDELTGLFNRRGMIQQIESMEKTANVNQISLSFIISDLDDFKVFNDTMGHLEGDRLLNELGTSLLKLMNQNQVIGRWGGEEFAICLLGSDLAEAQLFAEKIRLTVLDMKLPDKMSGKQLSMSLGVAELEDGEPVMNAVKRADKSLYFAKTHGKNQVYAIS